MFVALITVVLHFADNTHTLKAQELSIMEMTVTASGELWSLWGGGYKHALLFSILRIVPWS